MSHGGDAAVSERDDATSTVEDVPAGAPRGVAGRGKLPHVLGVDSFELADRAAFAVQLGDLALAIAEGREEVTDIAHREHGRVAPDARQPLGGDDEGAPDTVPLPLGRHR